MVEQPMHRKTRIAAGMIIFNIQWPTVTPFLNRNTVFSIPADHISALIRSKTAFNLIVGIKKLSFF